MGPRAASFSRLANLTVLSPRKMHFSSHTAFFICELPCSRTVKRQVFLGRMTSEIARVDRSMILPMAERLIAWTAGSKAMLEVQFEGESGFGDGATQSFYSEVALALMKRSVNKEVPMWVETDRSDESAFLHSARGL